jgi:hypothetical protein
MYDNKEFNDMAKRDKDMTLYSQSNVIASYISMIKFAIEKIELYVDEIGDEVFFDLDESIFPPDVLGDDSLFEGYTNPWSPDDLVECECDECRCKRVDPFGVSEDSYYSDKIRHRDAAVDLSRMSVGNIMDILTKTRKTNAPSD